MKRNKTILSILVLTIHILKRSDIFVKKKRILSIVLGESDTIGSKCRLNMNFDDDSGYLSAMLKIILPISYEVYENFDKTFSQKTYINLFFI